MTWRKWMPILVGLVLLFSCRDDDDSSTGGVFRFYLPDGYIQDTDQYWIILSDITGKVLDWKPLQNANTYSYALPDNVNGSVTVTTVRSHAVPGASGFSTDNTVYSYTHVPAGTYKLDFVSGTGTSGETVEPGYLKLSGFGATDDRLAWIYPQGMLTDTSDVDTGLELELTPFAYKTAILAIVRDEPNRYLYTEIESGKTITRSEADFSEFGTQTIALPEGTTLSGVQLTGNNAYGAFPYHSGVNQEVPIVSAFDSYTLAANLRDADNGNNLGYALRLTGPLPDEFPILESSLVNFTAKDDVVGWKTSTTGLDGVNITASKVTSTYSVIWTLVGEGGEQSVILPRIPKEIPLTGMPADVNARSFTALGRDGVTVELLNYLHYNGYQDYLRENYLYKTVYGRQDFLKTALYVTPE